MILPETSATKLLVADGRVHGIRTGDKGARQAGASLGTSSRARISSRR